MDFIHLLYNIFRLFKFFCINMCPSDFTKTVLCFYYLMYSEQILLYAKRGPTNLKECLTSLNHGILYESIRLFTRPIEVATYLFVYEHTGGIFLTCSGEVNYTWIGWCIGFIATDLFYYWVHRFKHEIHLLWSFHQVHHSSEVFELPVAVRQSIVELLYDFIFYIPLVIFLNPHYIVKSREIIYIYQLFIHTKMVNKLGPLEWIFNTPNHHRVHHACNRYCWDKNYGGVFIIWDRIFSTFQDERGHIQKVYGLAQSPKYYNVIYQQVSGVRNLIKIYSLKGLWDTKKLIIPGLFFGPRWRRGMPRLGCDNYKYVRQEEKDNSYEDYWSLLYICYGHLVLFLNAMELHTVQDMGFIRIRRVFEIMFLNSYIFDYFYDNMKVASVTLNLIRSVLIYNYYYDTPKWCILSYPMIYFDIFYFLLIWMLNIMAYKDLNLSNIKAN